MTTPPLKLPEIPAAEQTPLVQHLLQIIMQQQEEIQRLKGLKGKPKIEPSRLEAEASQEESSEGKAGQRASKRKPRKKTAQLTIHHVEVVKGLPKAKLAVLETHGGDFATKAQWQAHLKALGMTGPRHVQIRHRRGLDGELVDPWFSGGHGDRE